MSLWNRGPWPRSHRCTISCTRTDSSASGGCSANAILRVIDREPVLQLPHLVVIRRSLILLADLPILDSHTPCKCGTTASNSAR